MKRIAYILTAVLLCTATATYGGNLNGKKFYINPGHGGHDSDDRPTPLPLGVPMFYESDGSLTRGKHMGTFITANGGSYKLSRTTNNTADDLPLSTIAAQSNSYGGYFASLHSNAANASANYMVGFFRSSSSAKTTETISGAKAITEAAVKSHDATKLSNTTFDTPRALGDYSFYGYNLGVLRTNSRPGYLMESWFHDYRPEALRMKSSKYNKFLAWQLVNAFFTKPGGTGSLQGCVIGDIRNTDKKCGYTNYTTRGRDTYLAVNGAKVTLSDSKGTQVASMTTDNYCNGFYAFFDLKAGTYTLKVTKSGYKTKTASVTVADGKAVLKNFNVTEGADTGIDVESAKDFGTVEVGASKTVSVSVTGTGLSAAIAVASNNSVFTVDQTSLAKTGGTLKITFKPTAVGSITGKITLTSGTQKATISLTAVAKNPVLTFSAGKRYGKAYNATANPSGGWLPNNDWSLVRNMDYGNGKLYVVNGKYGKITVLNAQTFAYITDLRMPADAAATTQGTYKVMDVKVKGSKIFACNITTDVAEPTKVYQWDNDYAEPVCILNTKKRGSLARMGDTFDFEGNLTEGRLLFVGKNPETGNYKVVTYAVTNGTVATTPVNYGVKGDDGKYLDLGSSPRVVTETEKRFWVMGSKLNPTLLGADGKATKSINPECLGDVVAGNDFVRFKYKGDHYAIATTYPAVGTEIQTASDGTKTKVTARGQFGRLALLDGNNGWASAKLIKNYPQYGCGAETNTYWSTSSCVKVHKDDDGNEIGAEIWVLISKQGIQYFKHVETGKTLPAPKILAEPEIDIVTDVSDDDANLGQVEIGKTVTRKVNVTGTKVYSNIAVSIGTGGTSQANFAINTTSIKYDKTTLKASGTVTVTYKPLTEGKHYINLRFDAEDYQGNSQKFTVRFDGEGIEDSSVNPDPTEPDPNDPEEPDDPVVDNDDENMPDNDDITALKEEWNFSTTANTAAKASWLNLDINAGNYTRDIAVSGSKLYVLNSRPYQTPEITVVDEKTGNEVSKLKTTGISGGLIPGSSITMLGDKLIMSNAARQVGVGTDAYTDVLRIYRWDSDSEAPVLWLEDEIHGAAHYGEHMSVYGDMSVGAVYFCDGYKVFVYEVNDGQIDQEPTVITLSRDDKALAFHTLNNGMVHIALDGENGMWLNGKDDHPYRFDLNGEYIDKIDAATVGGSIGGTSVTAFKFGKRNYVASSTYLENATSGTKSLTGGALSLVEVTDGTYTKKVVAPEAGLGATRNTTFASRVTHAIANDGQVANLYVLTPGQGIAKYSFDGSIDTGISDATTAVAPSAVVINGRILIEGTATDAVLYNTTGNVVARGVEAVESTTYSNGFYILALKGADHRLTTVKLVVR